MTRLDAVAAAIALLVVVAVGAAVVTPALAQPAQPGASLTLIRNVTVTANTTTLVVPAGLRPARWSCQNTDAADLVYQVNAGAADLTVAFGPFCPLGTCVLGVLFGDLTGTAYVRSATDATLSCRYSLR